MPAPSVPTYSVAAKVGANTFLRDLIDSGPGPGVINFRDSADVLLAQATLNDPCGTVNGATGQVTFDITGVSDPSANATGTAAYGEFCDSTGTVHLALPTQLGNVPVAGKLVLDWLGITAGIPVTVVSAVIG